MKKIMCIVSLSIFLTGCVSGLLTKTYTSVDAHPSKTVHIPSVDVITEADVGQSMVSTARLSYVPAIQLEQDVIHDGWNNSNTFKLTIPMGVLLLRGAGSNGKFYQANDNLKFATTTGTFYVKGGIFVSDIANAPTEIYWLATDRAIPTPLNDVHAGIPYKPTIKEQWGVDSFKRELIYSGVSQNTISILYREFMNDLARPAFSQELKYDISQGSSIGYKGARFEVIKANNTGISYKVLKELD